MWAIIITLLFENSQGLLEWSHCSKTCGIGFKTRQNRCFVTNNTYIETTYCSLEPCTEISLEDLVENGLEEWEVCPEPIFAYFSANKYFVGVPNGAGIEEHEIDLPPLSILPQSKWKYDQNSDVFAWITSKNNFCYIKDGIENCDLILDSLVDNFFFLGAKIFLTGGQEKWIVIEPFNSVSNVAYPPKISLRKYGYCVFVYENFYLGYVGGRFKNVMIYNPFTNEEEILFRSDMLISNIDWCENTGSGKIIFGNG